MIQQNFGFNGVVRKEKPSTDRLDRTMADFRLDVHKGLAGLRLYLRALLAVSLLGTVVNVVVAFWKRLGS